MLYMLCVSGFHGLFQELPTLSESAVLSSIGGLDLDQLRLLEKAWGDTESQEPSAEESDLFPSPSWDFIL